MKNPYKGLVGRSDGRNPLAEPRQRRQDLLKRVLKMRVQSVLIYLGILSTCGLLSTWKLTSVFHKIYWGLDELGSCEDSVPLF